MSCSKVNFLRLSEHDIEMKLENHYLLKTRVECSKEINGGENAKCVTSHIVVNIMNTTTNAL